jgi:predicted nuclease with TOPRIM domain
MSSETDRLGERVASVETGVEQLNERVGTLEGRVDTLDSRMTTRFDRLDTKIDEAKRDVRRWLVLVVLATTLLTSVILGLVQVAL